MTDGMRTANGGRGGSARGADGPERSGDAARDERGVEGGTRNGSDAPSSSSVRQPGVAVPDASHGSVASRGELEGVKDGGEARKKGRRRFEGEGAAGANDESA